MRKLAIISLLVLLSLPASAKDLDNKITRRIDTITKNLDQMDQNLAINNIKKAQSSLKTATAEMDRIISYYGGKFDENHPDFVAINKRLTGATEKLKEHDQATAKAPAAKKVSTGVSTGDATKPLDSKVARRVQTISGSLDKVDQFIGEQDLKQAKVSLDQAQKEMAKIFDWHKGKFDESHPDFVAIENRLADSTAKVEGKGGLGDQAASMKQELEEVIGSLNAAEADIYAAINEFRQLNTQFSNAKESTDRMGDHEKVNSAISAMRSCVERGQAIHLLALKAANDFHNQFPDMDSLENLVPNGADAIHSVERIETFETSWDRVRLSSLSRCLPDAQYDIKSGLKAIERGEKNHDSLAHAISGGEYTCVTVDWIQRFSSAMLGSVEQSSSEMKELDSTNHQLKTELGKLQVAVANAKGVQADAKRIKLASARFPAVTNSGGEWRAVEKIMTETFEEDTKNKIVKRVTVHSPWDERTEARWINNHWVVGTYRYVGGTLLAQLPDGRFRVYRVSFRRTLQSNGDFGPLDVFGFGHSFEILKENINL